MIKGSLYSFPSAPCIAENLSVSLECNTSIATVWWNTTGVNQLYSVSAVNITGGVVGCGTSESRCTFNQLDCGEKYTVTVTGVTQVCTSQPSTSVDLSTGKVNRGRQVRDRDTCPYRWKTKLLMQWWQTGVPAQRWNSDTCIQVRDRGAVPGHKWETEIPTH